MRNAGCLNDTFSLVARFLRKRLGGRGGDADARDGLILVKRLFSLENESKVKLIIAMMTIVRTSLFLIKN